jgi:uncharacterized membrane protein
MIPLIILTAVFVTAYAINRYLLGGRLSSSFIGRFALALFLLIIGVVHFTDPQPMVQMMPDYFPYKLELVYFTGVCELAAVIGLLWNRTSKLTGLMLIMFFVAILPANIEGALRSVPWGGMIDGPVYLFFRIPMQILLIVWTWVFAVISVGQPEVK